MSIAARRSHQGDDYQLLIALHWTIRLLEEENEWEWIELEAISLPGEGSKVFVDDIVIGHSDGSRRFIQAKKNQPDRRAWSIADLKDELLNARDQLDKKPADRVIFYSKGQSLPVYFGQSFRTVFDYFLFQYSLFFFRG